MKRSFNIYAISLALMAFFLPQFLLGQNSLHIFSSQKMGTTFNISLYGKPDSCSYWAEKAFSEIDRINSIFSNYEDQSELTRVNQSTKWQAISLEFAEVVKLSLEINQWTEGTFDITIGKAIDLWKSFIRKEKKISLRKTKRLSHKNRVLKLKKVDDQIYLKRNRHSKLDFGAIAKGYAADKVADLFKMNGYYIFLIDAGGDLKLGEAPPGREFWRIQIFENENPKILELKNIAVATSGDTYQFIEHKGKRYAHILNPKTCLGIKNANQTCVIADKCSIADALSTSLTVQPKILETKKHYDFKTVIIQDGSLLYSDFKF